MTAPLVFTRDGIADACVYFAPDGAQCSVRRHAGHNRWYLRRRDSSLQLMGRAPLPKGTRSLRDALVEVAKNLKAPVALRLQEYTMPAADELRQRPGIAEDIDQVCVYYHHASGTVRSLTENYMLGSWGAEGRFNLTAPAHLPIMHAALADASSQYWIADLCHPSCGGPESAAHSLNGTLLATPGQELKPQWVEYLTDEASHDAYIESLKVWHGTPFKYGELTRQVWRQRPLVEIANPDGTITETRL